MNKPTKKQFIDAFEVYCVKHWHTFNFKDETNQFKTENWFGERMFVHVYIDGQIENRDRYHFDGKSITLFSSEYRYNFGDRWMER